MHSGGRGRDHALAGFDTANNAENQSFLAIRALVLALPRAAQGELDDGIDSESALLDLLSPVFAVDPRNSELALKRGKKLISALTRINAYLSAQTPLRTPINNGGKGGADQRQLLVSYVAATFDDGAVNSIEWRVGDGGFIHSPPADPSGNALGPFASGTRVQLRTRVNNSNATTSGSVRTLEIS